MGIDELIGHYGDAALCLSFDYYCYRAGSKSQLKPERCEQTDLAEGDHSSEHGGVMRDGCSRSAEACLD